MQKIITEKIGEKVIVLVQGSVDATDARLSRRISSPQENGRKLYVWIDCSSMQGIKTHGLCHFINQLLLMKSYGVQIILLNANTKQRQVFSALQLEHLFTFVPDFEKAYQLVQASS